MDNLLTSYLAELRAQLPPGLGWGAKARIVREVEEHILVCSAESLEQGQPAERALQQALARCGSPATIAQGFQAVVHLRRVRLARVGLLAAFALCIGLVGLTFLRYPTIAGSGAMTLVYLLIFTGIMGGYAWVGLPTYQAATPQGALALRQGATIGLLMGLLGTGAGLATDLVLIALWSQSNPASRASTLRIDNTIQAASFGIPFLIWLACTFASSVVATTRTRLSLTGLRIGLWSSIVYLSCSTVTGLVITHLLAGTLAQTVWSHDVVCQSAREIAACEIGDTLGGMTNLLLVLPLLGIGIGWFGGKLGSQERSPSSTPDQMAELAPQRMHSIPYFVAGCSGIFLIGLIGRLW